MKALRLFHNDESGQDLIEYSLIALVVALGALAGMTTLAQGINKVFTQVAGELT
jgi:pilus assembly protein Flp/PilA